MGLLVVLVVGLALLIGELNRDRAHKIQNALDLYRELEIGGLVLRRSDDWLLQQVKDTDSNVYMVYGLAPSVQEPSGPEDRDKVFDDASKYMTFVDMKSGDKLVIFEVTQSRAFVLRTATQTHQVRNSVFFSQEGESGSVPNCIKNYQGFYSFDLNEKLKEKDNLNAIFYIDDFKLAGYVTKPENLCDFITETHINQIESSDFDVTS